MGHCGSGCRESYSLNAGSVVQSLSRQIHVLQLGRDTEPQVAHDVSSHLYYSCISINIKAFLTV